MNNLRFTKFWLLLGGIMIGLVAYLSLIPVPSEMPSFSGLDKLIHFFVYAFLMLWFGLCYISGARYYAIGVGIILVGAVLELIQGNTGYRTMSYLDMSANSLGVVLGWSLSKTRLSKALVYVERILGVH
jgi:VanZ family protein